MIGFLLGISITLNILIILGLIIFYNKILKNNPLSPLYKLPKKNDDDIISKLKNKKDMEFWDL